MQLYSFNCQYPITYDLLPDRIRLANGLTRTDKSTFTAEELQSAGYAAVDMPPSPGPNEQLEWDGQRWVLRRLTEEDIKQRDIQQWDSVRSTRDKLLKEVDWRVLRYQSEVRLGVTTTDNIEQLDQYGNQLRKVTEQADPYNITWPIAPF